MPLPLNNDRWGYETNCFVCEPRNTDGLGIAFQLDDDQSTVSAGFTLDHRYSGVPTLLHGGVSLAILDEAMAWACIAVGGKWAMTVASSATFPAPVLVDVAHRVEAVLVGPDPADGNTLEAEARIVDVSGTVCVTATGTFVVVGDADPVTGHNTVQQAHQHLAP